NSGIVTRRWAGEVPTAARLPDSSPVENSRLWRHSARVSPTEFLRRQAPQKLLMGLMGLWVSARRGRRGGVGNFGGAPQPILRVRANATDAWLVDSFIHINGACLFGTAAATVRARLQWQGAAAWLRFRQGQKSRRACCPPRPRDDMAR